MSPPSFDGVREGYPLVEYSHILSRAKYPEYRNEAWNGIPLCPTHHRDGTEAVHRSAVWERYFYRFLPKEIKEKIGYVASPPSARS